MRLRRSGIIALPCALALAAFSGSSAHAQASLNTVSAGVFQSHVTSLRDMPFKTVIRQKYDYSCGSAALATLLRHHFGRPVDEAQVFTAMYAVGDQPQIRKVGFSLLDMKVYLKTIGLSADGYRETLDGLEKATSPSIAVIQIGAYRHFVVIKGVLGGKVMVGDPAQGLKLYSFADFAKIWNGVVFVIHPDGDQAGAFNQSREWATLTRAPQEPLTAKSLSGLTRDLPPIYQITPVLAAVTP